jgi:hypothetical protein
MGNNLRNRYRIQIGVYETKYGHRIAIADASPPPANGAQCGMQQSCLAQLDEIFPLLFLLSIFAAMNIIGGLPQKAENVCPNVVIKSISLLFFPTFRGLDGAPSSPLPFDGASQNFNRHLSVLLSVIFQHLPTPPVETSLLRWRSDTTRAEFRTSLHNTCTKFWLPLLDLKKKLSEVFVVSISNV